MATLYDFMDLEKQNNHLVGELKDAKRILQEYLASHAMQKGRDCRCDTCNSSKAWLARNKG